MIIYKVTGDYILCSEISKDSLGVIGVMDQQSGLASLILREYFAVKEFPVMLINAVSS